MAREEVVTRWHTFHEAALKGRIVFLTGEVQPSDPVIDKMVEREYGSPVKAKKTTRAVSRYPTQWNQNTMVKWLLSVDMTVPKVAIDEELSLMVQDQGDKARQALEHMRDKELLQLPYPVCLVEIVPMAGTVSRRFVYLIEIDEEGKEHAAEVLSQSGKKGERYDVYAMVFDLVRGPDGNHVVILYPQLVAARFDHEAEPGKFGYHFASGPHPFMTDDHKDILHAANDTVGEANEIIQNTLATVYLMMKTRGIARTEIEAPATLNKMRKRSGKPQVRPHLYVHVGHVFGKDGEAVKWVRPKNETPAERKERFKELRWVRAHSQRYWTGPGKKIPVERAVAAYFVNYDPAEGLTVPPPTVELRV